jgi:hypothetical protein
MGLMRWFPVVLVLTACGGAGGGSSGGGGGDDGGLGGDATASDSSVSDSAGGDARDASTSDGASDAGTTDAGGGDAFANDGPTDAPGDGADGDTGPAPVCSSGATGCVGSTPETCSGGQWVLADASCGGAAPICLAGACVPCTPGTTGCTGNASATCSSTGQWTGTVDCTATNQTCIAGTCTGACAPGQTQCSATGDGVQTCDSTGNWGTASGCVNQTCVAGACAGACAPGQTQCSGNGVETCGTTGTFGSPVDCGTQTCFEGQCGALVIAPPAQTVSVLYGQTTPTVQYSASINGNQVPASFAIDSGQIGSVAASTGLLTPTGTIGGTAHVTATYMNQQASTPVTVTILLQQNGDPSFGVDAGGAGGNGGVGGNGVGGTVTPTTIGVLSGAPTADPGLAWLYPYNLTTWPQGLLAPLLQWKPGTAGAAISYDAVRVDIAENGFYYTGYFSANGTPFVNIPINQLAWNVMSFSNTGEPVTVSLVFSSNGVAYGPITETWYVAPGTLQGTVYYNSYGTNLATNYCCTLGGKPFGGATLAIKSGATSPTLVAGSSTWPTNDAGCRVCHSVSADGSTLVTQHGDNYGTSSWYALATYAETPLAPAGTGQFAWPALFPNGSILLADGAGPPNLAGTGGYAAQLFNTQTGAAVASTGIPTGLKAGSPVFSPDGTHVAFTFSGGTGFDGISLAAMDYTAATSTFSNFRVLYTPANKAYTALWPSFMPTNNSVVFELQVQYNGRDWGGTRSPCDSTACANQSTAGAQGQLWWVNTTGTPIAAQLSTLNGLSGASLYVPTSASHANDAVLSFEPTVNPVASGGEAWIVFTTRRLYGNVATLPPYYSDPRYVDLTTQATPKKLWVAAMDLNAAPGTDPSHPAFYLPAQEILAGNSRGYWVVNPCQANGTSCQSGDECCGGYCEASEAGLTCSNQPPACSQLLDKCVTNADCCGANLGNTCINGFCSQPTFTQ